MRRNRAVLLLVLQLPVPWLVVLAASLHSWNIIHLQSDTDATLFSSVGDDRITSVSLSPDGVCLGFQAGDTSCQGYTDIILDAALSSIHGQNQHTSRNATSHEPLDVTDTVKSDADSELYKVLSSWCKPSGATTNEASLLTRGAESAMCLALVETCLFVLALWTALSSASTVLAAASVVARRPAVAAAASDSTCAVFFADASALLGFAVVLLWWSYSTFAVDNAGLSSLSLSWRYGGSFYAVLVAFVLSLASVRIRTKSSSASYAQLHALPSPSAAAGGDQDSQRCLRSHDPLACPANYNV